MTYYPEKGINYTQGINFETFREDIVDSTKPEPGYTAESGGPRGLLREAPPLPSSVPAQQRKTAAYIPLHARLQAMQGLGLVGYGNIFEDAVDYGKRQAVTAKNKATNYMDQQAAKVQAEIDQQIQEQKAKVAAAAAAQVQKIETAAQAEGQKLAEQAKAQVAQVAPEAMQFAQKAYVQGKAQVEKAQASVKKTSRQAKLALYALLGLGVLGVGAVIYFGVKNKKATATAKPNRRRATRNPKKSSGRRNLTPQQKKALAAYEFALRQEDRYLGSVFVTHAGQKKHEALTKAAYEECKRLGLHNF